MDSTRHDLEDAELLTEEHLKHMSRHIKDIVPQANELEPSENDIK